MEATFEATLTAPALDEQIKGALSRSPYIAQEQVQIEATDGCVRLAGMVGTFFQKQMAQELVRHVDGVQCIENRLQVNWK